MLIDISKKELEVIINQLWKSRKSEEQVGEVYDRLKPFLDICTCRENITSDDDYLDSLSEGKDLSDECIALASEPYSNKVDALVDSMGVTDKKVSTSHKRKDLDLL